MIEEYFNFWPSQTVPKEQCREEFADVVPDHYRPDSCHYCFKGEKNTQSLNLISKFLYLSTSRSSKNVSTEEV